MLRPMGDWAEWMHSLSTPRSLSCHALPCRHPWGHPCIVQKLCPQSLETVVPWSPLRPRNLYTDGKVCLWKDRPRDIVYACLGIKQEPFEQEILKSWVLTANLDWEVGDGGKRRHSGASLECKAQNGKLLKQVYGWYMVCTRVFLQNRKRRK